jgi:hypothetical protein
LNQSKVVGEKVLGDINVGIIQDAVGLELEVMGLRIGDLVGLEILGLKLGVTVGSEVVGLVVTEPRRVGDLMGLEVLGLWGTLVDRSDVMGRAFMIFVALLLPPSTPPPTSLALDTLDLLNTR